MTYLKMFFAIACMLPAVSMAEVDSSSQRSSGSFRDRFNFFEQKAESLLPFSGKNGAASSGSSKVSSLKQMFEKKSEESQKPLVQDGPAPTPTNKTKTITRTCEIKVKKESYDSILKICEEAKTNKNPQNNWANFYAKYQKNFSKLKELRDFGPYDPENPKNLKKLTLDEIKADNFEKFKPLTKEDPCPDYANQLSTVHPANNDVFAKALACIHDEKNKDETTSENNDEDADDVMKDTESSTAASSTVDDMLGDNDSDDSDI